MYNNNVKYLLHERKANIKKQSRKQFQSSTRSIVASKLFRASPFHLFFPPAQYMYALFSFSRAESPRLFPSAV